MQHKDFQEVKSKIKFGLVSFLKYKRVKYVFNSYKYFKFNFSYIKNFSKFWSLKYFCHDFCFCFSVYNIRNFNFFFPMFMFSPLYESLLQKFKCKKQGMNLIWFFLVFWEKKFIINSSHRFNYINYEMSWFSSVKKINSSYVIKF
jgi:hypothetical protein